MEYPLKVQLVIKNASKFLQSASNGKVRAGGLAPLDGKTDDAIPQA
jgi:hypothetical protein